MARLNFVSLVRFVRVLLGAFLTAPREPHAVVVDHAHCGGAANSPDTPVGDQKELVFGINGHFVVGHCVGHVVGVPFIDAIDVQHSLCVGGRGHAHRRVLKQPQFGSNL